MRNSLMALFQVVTVGICLLITSCAQEGENSSNLQLYKKVSLPIAPEAPIADIMATSTMQVIDQDIVLNYVDKRSQTLVTLYLNGNKKEEIKFEPEGPNSIGFIPDYFYLNTKKELIIGSSLGLVLCESNKELKVKEKFLPEARVLSQFLTGIRPGLQQQSKLIFFNYNGREFKNLILFDIEKFSYEEVKIPHQKEIFASLNSEAALSMNCTLPFVTIDENTLVFSHWYSKNVFEWDGKANYKEKKLELNVSKNPPSTFLNSWEKAVLELSHTSHGPVIRFGSNNLYIAEDYDGETKKAELFCLNDRGEKVFNLDVSNTQRFWVDGRLVKYLIDEDKNEINFEIWE